MKKKNSNVSKKDNLNVKCFFDEEIEENLTNLIKGTKTDIYLAMAWNTNPKLIDELLIKSECKKINVLINSERSNFENNYSKKKAGWNFFTNKKKNKNSEIKKNINLYIYHIEDKYNVMHNKFCVIDSSIVITGSFNWSEPSKFNRENIVVIESEELAKIYIAHFKKLRIPSKRNHFCAKIENRKDYKKSFSKKKIKFYKKNKKRRRKANRVQNGNNWQ